ncbi:hypothetical protein P3S68_026175 [Capsicum galapagoense]
MLVNLFHSFNLQDHTNILLNSLLTQIKTVAPCRNERLAKYNQAEGEELVPSVLTGSVKSLKNFPCFMSHATRPAEVREARGLTEDLIRISVGIEDVNDLIDNLDYAIKTGPT